MKKTIYSLGHAMYLSSMVIAVVAMISCLLLPSDMIAQINKLMFPTMALGLGGIGLKVLSKKMAT